MLLFELFDEQGSMIDTLRQRVMDYLTPLAAEKIEFIPIQDIGDVLQNSRTGLIIDRGLIMRLINPDDCKLVSKIEGDKVYLAFPADELSAKAEDDKEKEKEKISKTAIAQAKKKVEQK